MALQPTQINGLFYTIANASDSAITGLKITDLQVDGNLKIAGGATGKVLTYAANGVAYWANAASGSGTVTQVAGAGSGLGFSLTGGPITTSGTLTLNIPNATSLRTSLAIGNVANINMDGNVSNVLRGDGSWAADSGGSGSGVSNVTGNGSGLGFSLAGSVTSTGNLTLTVPSAATLITNMGLGNIATINATGNTTKFLREDGTWQTVSAGGTTLPTQSGNSGKVLSTDGTNLSWLAAGGTGTVTNVSANGSGLGFSLSGTVTTSGNITLNTPSTTALKTSLGIANIATVALNGITTQYLRGDGSWADVTAAPTTNLPNTNSNTAQFLRGDGSWAAIPVGSIATINIDGNVSNVLNGAGKFVGLGTQVVTGLVSGNNTRVSSATGTVTVDCDTFTFAKEKVNIATIPSTTLTIDVRTSSIYYNTGVATSPMTLNITNVGATMTNVGESMTVTALITNGPTAQPITSVTIDGGSPIAVKMLSGADLSGTASSIMGYTFNIIKTTATPTYTVIGSKASYK